MLIFRRLLFYAAQRIAFDPRVRAKAAELFEKEVKPRAEVAWRRTKPKLDAIKAELEDIADDVDLHKHPRKFAAKVKERFLDRDKRR